MAATPLGERRQHGGEVEARLREVVGVARRVLAVAALLDDPGLDQGPQAGAEDVARRAGVVGDVGEAVVAPEQLADDQQGPALAHELERVGDRARAWCGALWRHPVIPECGWKANS